MKISELVRRAEVPMASVKFYIREGMLPAGHATSATRAEYDESHLDRLLLIRSLTVAAGLPLSRAKRILNVIDQPEGSLYDMLGRAIAALAASDDVSIGVDPQGHPRASAALGALGSSFEASDARMPAFAQLDRALLAAEEAGLPVDPERLRVYGVHLMAIAEAEIDRLPADSPQAAIEYAVLGTALYEPVIASIRRLAHQILTVDAR